MKELSREETLEVNRDFLRAARELGGFFLTKCKEKSIFLLRNILTVKGGDINDK